ncbi:MAG: hypothetical protein WCI71_09080, partial [Bacteroidota bacterium]
LFSRVFILQKASHAEGILITILGSISQLLVTVLAGSAAMLIFIPRYMADSALGHGYLFYSLLTLIVSFDLLLMGLFFNVSFLTSLKERILKNGLTRLRKFFRVFAFYHNKEIGVVMLMSLLRYIVFSFQFFILLRLAGIPLPFYCAQLLISLIFFIMAIIPTVALAELGIRGSVSLFVLGLYFAHTDPSYITCNLCIFAASTFLWLINLGIPALLGTFFVFRLQFFRNRK